LLQTLSENHPKNAEIQVRYAKGLVNLTNKQQGESAVQKTVKTLENLYLQFKNNLMMATTYLSGLSVFLQHKKNKEQITKLVNQYEYVENLLQKQPNHPDKEKVLQILEYFKENK